MVAVAALVYNADEGREVTMQRMRTIGVLGGMSWESTAEYYRLLNEGVRRRLGGQHSAELVLYSVDFAPIERLQHEDRWDDLTERLVTAACRVEAAGAELLLLATNTMHRLAPALEAALSIPLLHIADATGEAIRAEGLGTVGLLGTRFTMEQGFYRDRLAERHGLRVLVPEAEGRELVHRVIYDELCQGRVLDASRVGVLEVCEALAARGAQGVVLGCTELPLLVRPGGTSVPVFDTTALHVEGALAAAFAAGA